MIRTGYWLLLGQLAVEAAPVLAETFVAPLPPGYTASGQPLVKGAYAEVTGLSSIFDDQELENLATECEAKGKMVTLSDQENRFKGAVRVYRSADAVTVIIQNSILITDSNACTARFEISRQIATKTGRWKFGDVPYFRDPDQKCGRFVQRCSFTKVKDIEAICIRDGDSFVGSVTCVSRRDDLTRGLELAFESYVDDDSMPTGMWQFTRVEANALIDPLVFTQR